MMNKREANDTETKINNLCKYILNKEYGYTLTFKELNEFIGEDLQDAYGKQRFKRIMNKCKNVLINYGYVLRSVMNVGYYILKPNQISSYTYRTYIMKPLRTFDKAKTILANVDRKDFDNNEVQKHALTTSLNTALIYATNELVNSEEYESLMNDEVIK